MQETCGSGIRCARAMHLGPRTKTQPPRPWAPRAVRAEVSGSDRNPRGRCGADGGSQEQGVPGRGAFH